MSPLVSSIDEFSVNGEKDPGHMGTFSCPWRPVLFSCRDAASVHTQPLSSFTWFLATAVCSYLQELCHLASLLPASSLLPVCLLLAREKEGMLWDLMRTSRLKLRKSE